MKKILFILTLTIFNFSSYAEEIGLFCKSKVTSQEQTLVEGLKEIHHEDLFFLDTSRNKLYLLSQKETWFFNDGTKKEPYIPIIYEELSSYNSIDFWEGGSSEKTYSFGWYSVNDKRYSIDVLFKTDFSKEFSKKKESFSKVYMFDKKTLTNFTKLIQSSKGALPEINGKCKRMN